MSISELVFRRQLRENLTGVPLPSWASKPSDEKRHTFRTGSPARRRLSWPLRRRLLRPADRRPARGRHEFRQVPGRVVGQHRLRLRALGLKTGLISRIGDDANGHFLVETIAREGCDTSHVSVDSERSPARSCSASRTRTRSRSSSCARTAPTWRSPRTTSRSPTSSSRARCSSPARTSRRITSTRSATWHSTALGPNNVRTILDIDYRPVLWGLTRRGDGETRFIASGGVTAHLQRILPRIDLAIGTIEEFQHRRRQHGHHGVAACRARGDQRDPGREARRNGLRGDRRARSRRRSTTRSTAKASRSRC